MVCLFNKLTNTAEKLQDWQHTDWKNVEIKDGFIWGNSKYWKNSTVRPGLFLLDFVEFKSAHYNDDCRYIWLKP